MLYVVATPIGNLSDISLRALEVLKSVHLIAAEDTRHSGSLLKHFEIKKPLVSYHEHNEAMRTAQLVERLAAGENIALITDAGTPTLRRPGAHKKIRGVSPRDCPRASRPLRSACAERRDRAPCWNCKRFLDIAGNDKRIAAGYFRLSKRLTCGILRGFFSPE